MDVSIHQLSDPPAWLAPLLAALEAHGADRNTPDGLAVFCPDAVACPPPAVDAGLVGFVPDATAAATRESALALRATLLPWAQRGATLLAATPPAAQLVRDLLGLGADRTRVLGLPAPSLPAPALPIPAAGPPAADTVLAIGPIDSNTVFGAVRAARLAGDDTRVIVSGPGAAGWTRAGGIAGLHELMPGRDATHVQDWHTAVDEAGVLVLGEPVSALGFELREALATGRPVIVPESPAADAHLNASGASALRYAPGDAVGLAAAITAALHGDRATALAVASAAAVRRETSQPAAAVLFDALCAVVDPPVAAPAVVTVSPRTPVPEGERLRVVFLSPLPAFGGHATIIRSFLRRLCADPRRPAVTVVAAADAGPEAGLMQEVLSSAGADRTRVVPMHLVDDTLAQEIDGAEVVYSVWPHGVEPPPVAVPVVATFYDMNWWHFDHLPQDERRRMVAHTRRWLQTAQLVCSSEFVAGELGTHFGADAAAIPIIPTPAPNVLPPPSADAARAVRRRFALPERFMLCPAGNHPSKNYAVLHAACRRLRRAGTPITVVATGMRTERFVGPDLIGLGYVDTTELRALVELAAGVVQPTLYEAGSFPMLEALSCGRPAAVSDIPAITEQLRRWDLRTETFDARDPQSCARAMQAVLAGARDGDAEHNARAVRRYTWDDFAGRYLDVMYARARPASNSVRVPAPA